MNTDFCDTDNCFFPVSSSLKPTHTEHSKYRYDISEKTDLYQCAAAKCPSPGEVVGKLVPKNHRHSPNPAMSFFLQFLSILYNSPGKSHVCSSISHSHPMNFILFPSFRRFAAPSHRIFAASKKRRAGWFSRDASASDHESLPGTWEKQISAVPETNWCQGFGQAIEIFKVWKGLMGFNQKGIGL